MGILVIHVCERCIGQNHFSIVIKNIFQGLVDILVGKESSSILILHQMNKKNVYWETNKTTCIVCGTNIQDCVQHVEHLFA